MATILALARLLEKHGWKCRLDIDEIEDGRAAVVDWTHPKYPGVTVNTWKKNGMAWWGDPAKHATSESIQELADWLQQVVDDNS